MYELWPIHTHTRSDLSTADPDKCKFLFRSTPLRRTSIALTILDLDCRVWLSSWPLLEHNPLPNLYASHSIVHVSHAETKRWCLCKLFARCDHLDHKRAPILIHVSAVELISWRCTLHVKRFEFISEKIHQMLCALVLLRSTEPTYC